jgi:hypothetical protein
LGHTGINNDFSGFMKLYFMPAYQRDFFAKYVILCAFSNETIFNIKLDVWWSTFVFRLEYFDIFLQIIMVFGYEVIKC